ncbi:MAG TPA: hypothetical protein VH306_11945 [Gaiellaceae bacterium]|jgi:hypothetical protein
MRKTLTVLGAIALVLAISAGATAGARVVFPTGSVDGRAVKDGSLHLADLSPNAEAMIRDGWRMSTGLQLLDEDNLAPALRAKVDQPAYSPPTSLASKVGMIAGVENARAAGDRFGRSVDFPLPTGKAITGADVVVVPAGQTSAFCPGSFADPKASAGKLCVYLGAGPDGAANAGSYAVQPVASLGFELMWRAAAAGESRAVATYAYQAPAA